MLTRLLTNQVRRATGAATFSYQAQAREVSRIRVRVASSTTGPLIITPSSVEIPSEPASNFHLIEIAIGIIGIKVWSAGVVNLGLRSLTPHTHPIKRNPTR